MITDQIVGFSRDLFKRGYPYLSKLHVVRDQVDKIEYRVFGTQIYQVSLEIVDHAAIEASCTCPAFRDYLECKHIAACILEAGNRVFYDLLDKKTYYHPKRVSSASRRLEPLSKFQKTLPLFDRLSKSDSEQVFPDSLEEKKQLSEIWYGLMIEDYDWTDGKIDIVFKGRSELKSGKLGKIKDLKFQIQDIENLSRPDDRAILRQILPFINAQSDYHNNVKFDGAVLGGREIDLLEKILKTGRAFQRQRRYGYDEEFVPLEFSPGLMIEAKIKTDMEKKSLRLIVTNHGREMKSLSDLIVSWEMGLAFHKNCVYRFQTYLPRELFRHLQKEKEIFFEELEFNMNREYILTSLDHRAISGDFFGLPVTHEEAPIELYIKLPLHPEMIQARLKTIIPPVKTPVENLTFYTNEKYDEIKQELEMLSNQRISKDGFFAIPVDHFTNIVNKAGALGLTVKADKIIIKSSTDFNISISHGMNWFEIEGSAKVDGEKISLPAILKLVKDDSPFVEFKKGELTYIPEEWLKRVKKISEISAFEDGKFIVHESRAQQLESLEVPSVDLSHFMERIRSFKSLKKISVEKNFQGQLRDYQLFGLSWMNFLQELGLGGCLADDMGLGKTVQVAAHLQIRQKSKDRINKLSLVICPKSLVFNWKSELQKFAPDLKVELFEGGHLDLSSVKADILITTYGLVQRHCEKMIDHAFDYIILDEAQAIKNARALTSKAIFTLKASHRLALTGTPVENHIGEFYSIFNFLMPGAYKNEALNPNPKNTGLARALKPFVLRRTKEQVLQDLPDKIEQVIYCDQEADEKKHYADLKDFIVTNLNKKIEIEDFKKSSIMVLEALTRLRQASCHPGLVNPELRHIPSGKIEVLRSMLHEIVGEGHKVVIFSQFTTLLKLVRERLGHDKENSVYLDGSTNNREVVVNDFKDSEKNIFYISIKAGGTGLNLTEASYCILLDPWWNPAVEDQAIARLHRMGQKKSVNVYRLITKSSIEEKVLELQKAKKELIADVLDENSEGFIRSLSRHDLEFLLN